MKKLVLSIIILLLGLPAIGLAAPGDKVNVAESFEATVLTEELAAPWEMIWGPDNMLWVTEREGSKVVRINPANGEKKVAATIEGVFADMQHNGLLGLAFAPGMTAKKGQIYLTHTYKGATKDGKDGFWAKIIRMDYDGQTEKLTNPVIILDGIPAGNDHNAGRLVFGPDGKLYASKGELGHNQGANQCLPIEAQRLATAAEVEKGDWSSYVGKILRINPDGSIPADNPVINGVKSHIFSYGHRNPQGLVFVGKSLFSAEHGPSSDDEINRIIAGGNYGWPHVAGYLDNNAYQYANWSAAPDCAKLTGASDTERVGLPASVPVADESDWAAPENFQEPIKTFFTVPKNYNFDDARCKNMPYLCWPTIAPSSLIYYPETGPIKGWRNNLLVTALKNGALYAIHLNANKQEAQGDVGKYFHTPNRYRVACLNPDLTTLYIATDVRGNALGYDGKPVAQMGNPGAIIKLTYKP